MSLSNLLSDHPDSLISCRTAAYLELSDTAIEELLLLISFCDNGGQGDASAILRNIGEKGYYRRPWSQLTFTLEHHLTDQGYVGREDRQYALAGAGRTRLRDLCELAHASPSMLAQCNREAMSRIRELRQMLGIFPFTNGRPISKRARVRIASECYVYAILLHETALQFWYRIKNSKRNPRLPCVYVGMTKQTPLKRFDEHRFGWKGRASKYVHLDGLCLMPTLYSHFNVENMSRAQALEKEGKLAAELRQHGFAVFAGHHDVGSG